MLLEEEAEGGALRDQICNSCRMKRKMHMSTSLHGRRKKGGIGVERREKGRRRLQTRLVNVSEIFEIQKSEKNTLFQLCRNPGGGGHLDNFWVGMCRPGL